MSPPAPVGGGRRPSRRCDDFRVRVTGDVISSIQMVNIENVREFVPILFAARSLSQPVNSEITKIHKAEVIEKYMNKILILRIHAALRVRAQIWLRSLKFARFERSCAWSPFWKHSQRKNLALRVPIEDYIEDPSSQSSECGAFTVGGGQE